MNPLTAASGSPEFAASGVRGTPNARGRSNGATEERAGFAEALAAQPAAPAETPDPARRAVQEPETEATGAGDGGGSLPPGGNVSPPAAAGTPRPGAGAAGASAAAGGGGVATDDDATRRAQGTYALLALGSPATPAEGALEGAVAVDPDAAAAPPVDTRTAAAASSEAELGDSTTASRRAPAAGAAAPELPIAAAAGEGTDSPMPTGNAERAKSSLPPGLAGSDTGLPPTASDTARPVARAGGAVAGAVVPTAFEAGRVTLPETAAARRISLAALAGSEAATSAPDVEASASLFEMPALAPALPTASPPANAPTPTATLSAPLGTPEWGRQLEDGVTWVMDQNLGNAQLKLNPANLGPLDVRISITEDRATVWFGAQHAATREALEAAAPRLRDMLAAQGYTSVSVNVDVPPQSNGGDRSAPGRYEPESVLAAEPDAAPRGRPAAAAVAPAVSRTRLDAFA